MTRIAEPIDDADEKISAARLAARKVVSDAGLPLWRKLVDHAELMLKAHTAAHAAKLLKMTVQRLPTAPSLAAAK